MGLISVLTRKRSIPPFLVGVFFLGAAATCWLGPEDDPIDVESVILDTRRLIEQGQKLQDAVSRNDWQAVAKSSEQIKQDQEKKLVLQARRDAWKPTWRRAKQVASIVFAICFILIASSHFIAGFHGQFRREGLHSDAPA